MAQLQHAPARPPERGSERALLPHRRRLRPAQPPRCSTLRVHKAASGLGSDRPRLVSAASGRGERTLVFAASGRILCLPFSTCYPAHDIRSGENGPRLEANESVLYSGRRSHYSREKLARRYPPFERTRSRRPRRPNPMGRSGPGLSAVSAKVPNPALGPSYGCWISNSGESGSGGSSGNLGSSGSMRSHG